MATNSPPTRAIAPEPVSLTTGNVLAPIVMVVAPVLVNKGMKQMLVPSIELKPASTSIITFGVPLASPAQNEPLPADVSVVTWS